MEINPILKLLNKTFREYWDIKTQYDMYHINKVPCKTLCVTHKSDVHCFFTVHLMWENDGLRIDMFDPLSAQFRMNIKDPKFNINELVEKIVELLRNTSKFVKYVDEKNLDYWQPPWDE